MKSFSFHVLTLIHSLSVSPSLTRSLWVCQPFLPNEVQATQEVMLLCGRLLPPVINRLVGNVSPPLALSQLCTHECTHTNTHTHTLTPMCTHTAVTSKKAPHILSWIMLHNATETYINILYSHAHSHRMHRFIKFTLAGKKKIHTYTANTCTQSHTLTHTHTDPSHLTGSWRKGYSSRWNTLLFSLLLFLSICVSLSKG